jgi:hypothetical protein
MFSSGIVRIGEHTIPPMMFRIATSPSKAMPTMPSRNETHVPAIPISAPTMVRPPTKAA